MSATVYSIVTSSILEAMKQGIVPWEQPWISSGDGPRNAISGKYYRGINTLLLGIKTILAKYESNVWVTYKQAAQLGGTVRKGEKATAITFWKQNTYKKANEAGDEESRRGLLLRYYNVFNVAQCDGLKLPKRITERVQRHDATPIEAAEALIEAWEDKPSIQNGDGGAFYIEALDYINMPKPATFESMEAYYGTLFHEMTHATGHESRLNRETMRGYRKGDNRPKEELIAEIGGAFLSNICGIDTTRTTQQTVAYLQNWMQRLEADDKLILSAAGQAQKAVDYIVGDQAYGEAEDANVLAEAA